MNRRVLTVALLAALSFAPARAEPVPAETALASIPVLVSGKGFAGATPEADPVGNGAGADAKAIARWDVVPYQTVTGRLPIGVVAFHMAGIDRVDFSLNGGPWTAVRAMTQNPVTNVWEYNAAVDAAALPDGPIEVRAIVHPRVGYPRVLAGPQDESPRAICSGEHSLFLWAGAKGGASTLERFVSPKGDDKAGDGSEAAPFATIERAVADIRSRQKSCEGATIELAAGEYAWPDVPQRGKSDATQALRWLTVSAAPGVGGAAVRFTSSRNPSGAGFDVPLLHLRNLTVKDLETISGTEKLLRRIWAEGCLFQSKSPLISIWMVRPDQWRGGVYMTDCTIRNVRNASWGVTLARHLLLANLGGDGLRDPQGMVIDCEQRDIVNSDDAHCDVCQFVEPPVGPRLENVIVYGLRAVSNVQAQALFVQQYGDDVSFENFAFVNYLTYADYGAQWQNPGKHVLLWNMAIVSPPSALAVNKGGLMFVDVNNRPTSVHDLSVRNSIFQRLNVLQTGAEPSAADTSWADTNHYIDVRSYMAMAPGHRATTGGTLRSLFRDAENGDFSPADGSPLCGRVHDPLVPADAWGRPRRTPDSVGACSPQ